MLTDADLPEGITLDQISCWYDLFRFYRHPPSKEELINWLKQFDSRHYKLGAKVLDAVILVSDISIQRGYRKALHRLPGWSIDEA